MIALLLALQATVTEALPADVSAAAAQTVAGASHGGINYLDLMLKASIPVKLIVLLLLAGSFISWVIIFRKSRVFKAADRAADEFENRFWSGAGPHRSSGCPHSFRCASRPACPGRRRWASIARFDPSCG